MRVLSSLTTLVAGCKVCLTHNILIRDMKSLKIFSLAMVLLLALTGCGDKERGKTDKGLVAGEWQLAQWNDATPEFKVYIDFNADGTFEMYQQVWSFDYEYFEGNYTITDDIVTGTYSNGTNWACGYKFEILDGQLKLASQEDQSVVSIYESCTIPAEIKEEATATRSTDVVPFL